MTKKTWKNEDQAAEVAAAERETRELARLIERGLPPSWRFMLVLADGAPEGFMTYVSNGRRDDVLALLEELRTKLVADKGH